MWMSLYAPSKEKPSQGAVDGDIRGEWILQVRTPIRDPAARAIAMQPALRDVYTLTS